MTITLPQPAKRGRGTANTLKQFAAQLQTMPGEWVPYPFVPSSKGAAGQVVRKINAGTPAFPAGQFLAALSGDRVMVKAVGVDA